MMLAVPKSDILQAIMVSYGNREEIKEFLGECMDEILITQSHNRVSVAFHRKLFYTEDEVQEYQVATKGDIIVKATEGGFMVLKPWMFDALFDYHFVPDKPPEEWENSNDREVPAETGQS